VIFFFYGKEAFEPLQRVQDFRERFLVKNPAGSGYHFLDCGDGKGLGEIGQTLSAQNLFAPEQLVVVKDFFVHHDSQAQKELIPLLERTDDDVVVIWEQAVPRKNAKLFTWLTKHAHEATHYDLFEGVSLSRWVSGRFIEYGGDGDARACVMLIAGIGNDLFRLDREILKLVTYAAGRRVTSDDVESLVKIEVAGDIFGAVEVLAHGDRARALNLMHKQIASGDDIHYIFSMYLYQIRTLLSISGMYHDQGQRNKNVIAKTCKLHPYVVQKSLPILARISKSQLLRAHDNLVSIDQDMKLGKRDVQTALTHFVTTFS